jgi:hypothetical protein
MEAPRVESVIVVLVGIAYVPVARVMTGVAVVSARLTVAQAMDVSSTRKAENIFTLALLRRGGRGRGPRESEDVARLRRRLRKK